MAYCKRIIMQIEHSLLFVPTQNCTDDGGNPDLPLCDRQTSCWQHCMHCFPHNCRWGNGALEEVSCRFSESVYGVNRIWISEFLSKWCSCCHCVTILLLLPHSRHVLAIRNRCYLRTQRSRASLDDRRKIVAEHTSVTKRSLKIPGDWNKWRKCTYLIRFTAIVDQPSARGLTHPLKTQAGKGTLVHSIRGWGCETRGHIVGISGF